jgi:hypothetical protein
MNEQHATDTAFGQTINLCDDARRFLLQRATQSGGAGFTVRGFASQGATCADCLAILKAQSPFVLPMPVIEPGPAPRNTNLKRAIRASMLAKYGPSIEDPEWATE